MNFYTSEFLGPRFVIFHYFIKWYIDRFGIVSYIVALLGGIMAFFTYVIMLNLHKGEKDVAMMITLLAVIVMGGLMGLGIDISNGHAPIV
ncbi:hypothetical protein SAMN02745945_00892 [Peptoclostridium litorale DSM 5388]|uniref:Uncharacterized protein n=1 Tax=Peptoclostridium litorale DSM 5388 TaxID=1121324 RepID=A0A069RIZ0_PEPLI|nr:hypothetical protein CLIT_23c04800 [Peptoclostridium litorale DSM 5388]SIN82294.1 hypothetical protein SAMN02745945_00892 [Peptoclostridium litorale DSM 5388]